MVTFLVTLLRLLRVRGRHGLCLSGRAVGRWHVYSQGVTGLSLFRLYQAQVTRREGYVAIRRRLGAGGLLLRDQQGPISTGCHDGEDSIGPWLDACWGMGGDMLGHVAM